MSVVAGVLNENPMISLSDEQLGYVNDLCLRRYGEPVHFCSPSRIKDCVIDVIDDVYRYE